MDAMEYMQWLQQQPQEVREEAQRDAVARMDATRDGFFALSPAEQSRERELADQVEEAVEERDQRVLAEQEADDEPEPGW
jgi:hypothetical protein